MMMQDIIVAPATALGGAIAVLRLSGAGSIACCDSIFRGRKPLAEAATHTLHYGTICDDFHPKKQAPEQVNSEIFLYVRQVD